MRFCRKIQLWLIAGLFFQLPAQAALQLELTQGMNAAIPIVIVPFANQTSNVSGNTTLSQVISNDLQNSGEFNVKAPGMLASLPVQVSQINTTYWQKQGANDIVIGQVHPLSAGKYEVLFQLVNLYAPVNPQNPNAAVLLNQGFTVNQAGMRGLAHHISDMIYQKLTGVRGIFSTKIAYVLAQHYNNGSAYYRLIVADEDGFGPQTLLSSGQPIMSPTWSHDGHSLAYVSFQGHYQNIYLQNLLSGSRQVVANFPGINSSPAFSPNNRRLAMVLTLNTGNPNIYVMDLATHHLTQITNDTAIDTEPTWSPDGSALFFTSSRAGGPEIYRYNFADHQVARVTFDGGYNARACLTPHANTLVIIHADGSGYNIAKQDLNSGRLSILTGGGSDDSPSLAPNGKMILYGTRFAGHEMLGLVSMDGRVKLRLPSQQGDVQDPSWSPFL
ncbi:MAG: Tol-Pal system beta propeller repeat protein TolB [Gammaproteobacteria bacterium RIFCSPHIGHO2_12_FULL_38_11]|nr:MAG: Tol-Pal system beta propeller repeat protein TolB [Gammaproteobacteria bacterium RIFCSPHIGHO2_12_FULL_38_11]